MIVSISYVWRDDSPVEVIIHVEGDEHNKIRTDLKGLNKLRKEARRGRSNFWGAIRTLNQEDNYPSAEKDKQALITKLKNLKS
jgi:hypothetical protein